MNMDRLIERALRDNADAIAFVEAILRIVEVWDALIDGDETPCPGEIHQAFIDCLLTLPNNPFYATHRATLEPVLVASIMSWRIATRAERSDERAREWAFAVRSNYVDLIIMAAALIGGITWGVEIGLELRAHVAREGYDGYVNALELEREARGED